MLGYARSTTFAPGVNLKAQSAGAAWAFVLESLELGLVLCVGVPPSATLRTLSRLADEIVVVCPRRRDRRRLRPPHAEPGIAQVCRVVTPAGLPARRADVALVSGRRAAALAASNTALAAALRKARMSFVDAGVGSVRGACTLRVSPADGEARTAAAESDAKTLAYIERADGARADAGRLRVWRRAQRSRRAELAAPGIESGPLRPPAYIRALARESGVVLDDYRAGLVAPSEYASRKALMFLFRGDDAEPEVVVKIVRDRGQTPRLENEWRALTWMKEAGVPGVLPRPLFFGRPAGLAVLGETAVAGTPFRRRTSGRPDCRAARAALEWLLALGAVTAHPPASPADVPDAIRDLAERFESLYLLSRSQRAGLRRHVDAFQAATPPLVLQHGDPGTWNLLVSERSEPAFLDWEAAELDGMPLWDVFYFTRSFAVTVGRAAGARNSLAAVRRELLRDSPISRLLAAAVARQRSQTGLEQSLVQPLFVTCWMHRALKEATRLSPDRLDQGHYAKLVRLSLDEPDAPGLRRVFSSRAAAAEELG